MLTCPLQSPRDKKLLRSNTLLSFAGRPSNTVLNWGAEAHLFHRVNITALVVAWPFIIPDELAQYIVNVMKKGCKIQLENHPDLVAFPLCILLMASAKLLDCSPIPFAHFLIRSETSIDLEKNFDCVSHLNVLMYIRPHRNP